MTDKNSLIEGLVNYINENGGDPSKWYTGIATKAKVRLGQHNAMDSLWKYDTADSSDIAREVETHMIDVVGTQGGSGGGDDSSVKVYCYKITQNTIEDTG